MSETDDQIALVQWLDLKKIIFFHIPNGSYKTFMQRIKFRKLGLKAGVPDLFFPYARRSCHGLFIELKPKHGGSLSPAQADWLNKLVANNYFAVVCHGFDEAVKIIDWYLNSETN